MNRWREILSHPPFDDQTAFSITSSVASEIISTQQVRGFPAFIFHTLAVDEPVRYDETRFHDGNFWGSGVTLGDPGLAMTKSLFETLERKYSRSQDPSRLIYGSRRSLGPTAVSPESLSLLSPWEKATSPKAAEYCLYSDDLPLHWVSGHRLTSSAVETAYLPAAMTFSQFSWSYPQERLTPNLSPGLACHVNTKSALLNGLLEILERDAFMISWFRKENPAQVIFASPPPALKQVFEYLESRSLELVITDLTTEMQIPIMAASIFNDRRQLLSVGLGCDWDAAASWQKAIQEAILFLSGLGLEQEANFSSEAVDFLHFPGRSVAAEEYPADVSGVEERLQRTVQRIEAHGKEVYFADLTPPRFAGQRFVITRALISDMQPMLYDEDLWRLNMARINACRFLKADVAPPVFSTKDLNLKKHPFQ